MRTDNRGRWRETGSGPRHKSRSIPRRLRARIIATATDCWFQYPDICTGLSGRIEIHHLVDVVDGGAKEDGLVAACRPCHQRYSAQRSQQRAVKAAWDWKRQPERRPDLG